MNFCVSMMNGNNDDKKEYENKDEYDLNDEETYWQESEYCDLAH